MKEFNASTKRGKQLIEMGGTTNGSVTIDFIRRY